MYFTNDSMLPENQQPLIITVAPYGPQWLPSDSDDIPVTWGEQTQRAVDCYNAGATVLHLHVRDPKTGHGSKNFNEFNEQIARLRKAVPKMVIQVGGSISFAPASDEEKAQWLGYDTRHMLTELNPKPDQITIVIGTTQMNILDLTTPDDVQGTHFANPVMQAAYQNMVAEANPEFYIEHLKRLRQQGIQPMFAMAHVHTLEAIELLIRTRWRIARIRQIKQQDCHLSCAWLEIRRDHRAGHYWRVWSSVVSSEGCGRKNPNRGRVGTRSSPSSA